MMLALEPEEIFAARLGFAECEGRRQGLIAGVGESARLAAMALATDHRVTRIKRRAAAIYGVSIAAIDGRWRTGAIVRARQYCMYHAVKLPGLSLPDIGRRLGGRDHSTVIHGARVHALRHGLPIYCPPRDPRRFPNVVYEGPEPALRGHRP